MDHSRASGFQRLEHRMASRASRILQGARDALDIAKGAADPETYRVHAPDLDVRSIRDGLGMTQAAFAKAFGLSIGTVQAWEHGQSQPDEAGRAYLQVIRARPHMVKEVLAGR